VVRLKASAGAAAQSAIAMIAAARGKAVAWDKDDPSESGTPLPPSGTMHGSQHMTSPSALSDSLFPSWLVGNAV
jgi:hypothetical protein